MAKFRKECWTDADVKCPFYIADDRHRRTIRCEGYAGESCTETQFPTLALRDRHMGVNCVQRYSCCPMYRLICQCKYAEEQC